MIYTDIINKKNKRVQGKKKKRPVIDNTSECLVGTVHHFILFSFNLQILTIIRSTVSQMSSQELPDKILWDKEAENCSRDKS